MLNYTVFNIFKGHVVFLLSKINEDATRFKTILVLFNNPKLQFIH